MLLSYQNENQSILLEHLSLLFQYFIIFVKIRKLKENLKYKFWNFVNSRFTNLTNDNISVLCIQMYRDVKQPECRRIFLIK